MPKKKSTSAEHEPEAAMAAQDTASLEAPATEPGNDVPKARRKTRAKPAAKKPATKKSAKAKAAATAELPVEREAGATAMTAAVEAEAAANAADTFEDALEANDLREARTAMAAADSGAPIAQPEPVTAREPDQESGKEGDSEPAPEPAEADELAGDWESGSGDEEREQAAPPPAKQERLQKILAAAGVASRRHAEELIVAGRVQVNGQVVTTLGSKADPARDHIRVDGKLIQGAERLRYFVLNKPRGYVTTVSDPEGRPTVMQFFERMRERLYPVGRLDYQSEGLLLMTNDGELANKLTRAASGVEKIYLVKVAGRPEAEQIEALRSGVRIDRARRGEGKVETAPARVRLIRQGENPWFEVGLIEGRNRELRKMFEEIGHRAEKIRRVGYGPLELDVEPGKMRELAVEEVQALRLAAEGKLKPKRVHSSAMLPKEAGRRADYEAAGQRGGRPAQRRETQRGHERAGQKWQDRRRQDQGRRGENREREQRGYDDRDRRQGRGDRGGFAPRRDEFGGRDGRGGERGGAGRGFDRDRPQRSGNARPQGQRPFGARPGSDDRRFRGRPESERERPPFEGRPRREGFEDRGSRPARGGFRPERGSGPKRGGFRPEPAGGFRAEGGREQRRGQGGGFGQRFGRAGSGQRGPGPARTERGQRGGGEGHRGGFGRKSGPPKFGGRGRPGGNKGRRP